MLIFCIEIQQLRDPVRTTVTDQSEDGRASLAQPFGDLWAAWVWQRFAAVKLVVLTVLSAFIAVVFASCSCNPVVAFYVPWLRVWLFYSSWLLKNKGSIKETALGWAALKLLSYGRWQWLPTPCPSLDLCLMVWSSKNLGMTQFVSTPIPRQEVALSFRLALVAWPLTVCIQSVLNLSEFGFLFTMETHKMTSEQRLIVTVTGNKMQRF